MTQGNKPHIGLRKVVSPVSGATLVTAHSGDKLKDPLTGFPLRLVSTGMRRAASICMAA